MGIKLANGPITGSAQTIANKIDEVKEKTGVSRVDLVGFSMGGLAAQHYGTYGFRDDVRKIIMVGTPLHGSDFIKYVPIMVKALITALVSSAGLPPWIADIANQIVNIVVGDAGPQMEPGSAFLTTLNQNNIDPAPEWALYEWPGDPDTDLINPNIDYLSIRGVGPAIGSMSLPITLTVLKVTDPVFGITVGQPLVWFGDFVTNTVSARIYDGGNVENVKVAGLKTISFLLAKDDENVYPNILNFLENSPGFNATQFNESTVDVNQALNGTATEVAVAVDGIINQSQTRLHNFTLDPLAEDLRIKLQYGEEAGYYNFTLDSYLDCSNKLNLSLIRPNQSLILPGDADNSIILYYDTSGTVAYAIHAPDIGNWSLVVGGENITCPDARYSITATFNNRLFVGVTTGNETYSYEPGDNVTIMAIVKYNNTILPGLNVSAQIMRFENLSANTTPVAEFPLFDDGIHGDFSANDGLYANNFTTDPELQDAHMVRVLATINLSLINKTGIVNRSALTAFFVELLPELTLNSPDITFSDSAPNIGDNITIFAVIHNIGKGSATNASIEFRDGNDAIGFDLVNVAALGTAFANISWKAKSYGNHTITVIISPFNEFQEKDYFNNTASKQIFVGDTIRPVAIAGDNLKAVIGNPIFLDASSSFDNDRIVNYEWDIDVNNAASVNLTGVLAPSRGYNTTGNFTVMLTVIDAAGNSDSDTFNIEVVDGFDLETPILFAGAYQRVKVGEPVTFNARCSDNYGCTGIIWDFDIGVDTSGDAIPDNDIDAVGKEVVLKRGYLVPGTYIVHATADDAAGNGPVTDHTRVIVSDPRELICAGDKDCDRVFDEEDNCPLTPNPEQRDYDKDGIGDACWCTVRVAGFEDVHGAINSSKPGDVVCLTTDFIGKLNITNNSNFIFDCLGNSIIGNGTGVGIHLGTGITNTTVQNCFVEDHFNGIEVKGNNNIIKSNTVSFNQENGIFITGSGFEITDNIVCSNLNSDINMTGSYFGDDNICDQTSNWNDAGFSGCTFACHICTIPENDMNITSNTLFCPGTYEIPDGINIAVSGATLKCDKTVLIGSLDAIGIEANGPDNVKVKGCELQNYSLAIKFQESDNSGIIQNKILRNANGVLLALLANATIANNKINDNFGTGLAVNSSAGNSIEKNAFNNNPGGSVSLFVSGFNKLNDNIISDGIEFRNSPANQIINNKISFHKGNNAVNLISSSHSNYFEGNEVFGSSIDGFWVETNANSFINNYIHDVARGYFFKATRFNTIRGGIIEDAPTGIYFNGSSRSQVLQIAANKNVHNSIRIVESFIIQVAENTLNNILLEKSSMITITNNHANIELENSSSNFILDNNASNSISGIILSSSSQNTIRGNTAENNELGIILVESSLNNLIRDNYMRTNSIGIFINSSESNTIFNNIFNNSANAKDYATSTWNIPKTPGTNIVGGPYLGGNFWHDYNGEDLDNDGLGDTLLPYNSNGGIINGGDFLPLVEAPKDGNSSCGDTIYSDTNLTEDIINCPGNGLVIGSNDIALDCQGHRVTGLGNNPTSVGIGTSFDGTIIKNCFVANFSRGIYLNSIDNAAYNNTVQFNMIIGIVLGKDKNNVQNNTILNNGRGSTILGRQNTFIQNFVKGSLIGVEIVLAQDNTIQGNNIISNSKGIFLSRSTKNIIRRNYIRQNPTGIQTENVFPLSNDNIIFDNFFNNVQNAIDRFATNNWNTTKTLGRNIIGGPFIGGNFWHDYNGQDLDGDGLGDTNLPYNSNGGVANGGDFLPLMPAV